MPNQPKTPIRTVRIPDDLWQAFGDAVEDRSTVIRELLRWYLRRPRPANGAIEAPDTSSWVGIAHDQRTGHYWHAVPGQTLPACVHCWLWMTDWSLINECYATDESRAALAAANLAPGTP